MTTGLSQACCCGGVETRRATTEWGTHLIKSKTLAAGIPGKGPEKGVQLLGGISESSQVLAQDDDYVWTKPLRFCDQLELIEALGG
jgi:hypothetical protein